MIVGGAENRPPMLNKTMYNSWESHMFLYIKRKKNGRMMLESIKNGPLVYPTVKENGQVRNKKYVELTEQEKLQDDCDVQATTIVLQSLPPDEYALINHCQLAKDIWERVKLLMKGTELSYQERECKLYNEFDKFTSVKGESLHEYYLHFAQLINDIHTLGLTMQYLDPLALVANHQTQSNSAQYPQQLSSLPQTRLAVPSLLPGDDPIACLNKAMAFMSTVMASRFPPTNNQLRTSSNPRNQATIQDGRVTVQQDLQGLLSVITVKVKGTWQGSALCLMLGFRASTLSTASCNLKLYLQYKMSSEESAAQMAPVESPHVVSSVKLPILKKGEYTFWSMRMEQYLTNTDYALWQVIMNGDEPVQTTKDENGVETEDAKTLWAAIKSRFGGNVESKKMQKNVLKQHFENFYVSDTKGLDKAYDRFQKLISLLEVHGAAVSNEDANQKFLRALPSSWNNVALIMRNKTGIDDLDIDDLYNNLKVFEADIKISFRSSSNSHNVAFLSVEDTISINEVNTANVVSTASGHNSQGQASSSTYTDDLMFSFFANQSISPQLDDEDLEQIDHDDLEEIDLK
ncbi:hypothetical protein Tco_0251377 [Tanacetum coccineum]